MRLGLILWNAVTFIYYNWLKCSNTFLECCSLYLSCITFEHFLSVLADNWHDLQHGSMLRHSEQQRSYLGSSCVKARHLSPHQTITFRLGKLVEVEELPWGSVGLVVLFCDQRSISDCFCLFRSLHCLMMTSTAWTATVTALTFKFFLSLISYYWIITRGILSVHHAFFKLDLL